MTLPQEVSLGSKSTAYKECWSLTFEAGSFFQELLFGGAWSKLALLNESLRYFLAMFSFFKGSFSTESCEALYKINITGETWY